MRCAGLIVLLLYLAPATFTSLAADEPTPADRLVRQLGDRRYPNRQAAEAALRRLGSAAVPALHRAVHDTHDAELRRRASRLLETIDPAGVQKERVAAIRASRLSARAKGERLRAVLKPGIDRARVYDLIGFPASFICYDSWTEEAYPAYQLWLRFDRDGVLESATGPD